MQGQGLARKKQSQVVESGMVIGVKHILLEILLQSRRADKQHGTHGEVVAYRTELVVDERPTFLSAVRHQGVVVGIQENRPAVVGNGDQTGQGLIAQAQRPRLQI